MHRIRSTNGSSCVNLCLLAVARRRVASASPPLVLVPCAPPPQTRPHPRLPSPLMRHQHVAAVRPPTRLPRSPNGTGSSHPAPPGVHYRPASHCPASGRRTRSRWPHPAAADNSPRGIAHRIVPRQFASFDAIVTGKAAGTPTRGTPPRIRPSQALPAGKMAAMGPYWARQTGNPVRWTYKLHDSPRQPNAACPSGSPPLVLIATRLLPSLSELGHAGRTRKTPAQQHPHHAAGKQRSEDAGAEGGPEMKCKHLLSGPKTTSRVKCGVSPTTDGSGCGSLGAAAA